MEKNQVTAVIVGAGHRALIYADVSLKIPDKLRIVGVADKNPDRLASTAQRYGISEEYRFDSADSLARREKIADIVINGTMDRQHVPTSIPLINRGYGMLLEKPFATDTSELADLYVSAQKNKSKVFVCHVLRYSSFYSEIKRLVASGTLGKILTVSMSEDVSLRHMVVSYVRGKWNNEDTGTPILLAKSCHDIDIMMWLMAPEYPVSVFSSGSDMRFSPENATDGAGTRCLSDCPIESSCPFSAAKHYVHYANPRDFYVWGGKELSDEEKLRSLADDNDYGRCVWRCGHTGVDHQTVCVTFESGATGTFTLSAGAPCDERRIKIVGTQGTLTGVFEENSITVRTNINERPDKYDERAIQCGVSAECKHGGGDEALVMDFCDYFLYGKHSLSCSELSESLLGHLVVFAAERSRKTGRTVNL